MMRGRFGFLKHVLAALGVLVCLVCAAELALRYRAAVAGDESREPLESLVRPSWCCLQELKPLQSVEVPATPDGPPIRIDTNSWGVRGAEPEVPKPEDLFRILCLGDERVLAAGVPAPETFCARLEQALRRRTRAAVEVINAGVPGHCPLLNLMQYRQQLSPLEPNLILVMVDFSDVSEDSRYRRYVQMDPRLGPISCPHPMLLHSRPNRLQSVCREFRLAGWCLDLASTSLEPNNAESATARQTLAAKYAWLTEDPSGWEAAVSRALTPLVRLRQLSERQQAELVVATFPCAWQLWRPRENADGTPAAGRRLAAIRSPFELFDSILSQHRLRAFDLSSQLFSPQLAERLAELYSEQGTEFSSRGHAVYADQLTAFLESTVRHWQSQRLTSAVPFARH